jgi:hypothetical protein
MYDFTNPHDINLANPFVYFIKITSEENEYRYVGVASSASRLNDYHRNMERISERKTKRPPIKRNGEPQRKGNLLYRRVHLVLAIAIDRKYRAY